MQEWWTQLTELLAQANPWLLTALGLAALLLAAWVADLIAKGVITRAIHALAKASKSTWDDTIIEHRVVARLAQALVPIVIYLGAPLVPHLSETVTRGIQNVATALIALLVVLAVSAALNALNAIYDRRPKAHLHPIKGYVQVTQIVLFCIGAILVISAILDKSPLILLSGLGALTAVLLLVFRDTILSFVASIQLASLDMVRVGDWIEMPKYNADGDVIDVELHTVRVQNWDKTITTIPTHKLISDSFRNWRGMSRSGGRRIKRSLLLDMTSVRFLTETEIQHFRRFALLSEYIEEKQQALEQYNSGLARPTADDVNLRRLTNLGTFRAYVYNYLKNHNKIHQNMTLLVRQLQPGAEGIAIEIYCFTNTTQWHEYEGIQADLFDHLLAILQEFDLRPYQQPAGQDVRALQSIPASETTLPSE
ncbi:MAG: mechanosensitive ion channel family protein [Pseudomonadota bacterium]